MKFKDVAMHYIGCEMYSQFNEQTWTLTASSYYGEVSNQNPFTESKPILRKLEDMTEEDANHLGYLGAKGFRGMVSLWFDGDFGKMEFSAKDFHYLCQRGYDLFGLIDLGEAIDYKTVKK